jgi:hypothetical protein
MYASRIYADTLLFPSEVGTGTGTGLAAAKGHEFTAAAGM